VGAQGCHSLSRAGRDAPVSLALIQRSAIETVQIAPIVVCTGRNFRFMSIRFSAVRQLITHEED
jgi:hypothetical protein